MHFIHSKDIYYLLHIDNEEKDKCDHFCGSWFFKLKDRV